MHPFLAIRVFFQTLFSGPFAREQKRLLEGPKGEFDEAPTEKSSVAQSEEPKRNEAITLLGTLQREARLVDFLMESLDAYSDSQIGAAVRDVHRESRKTLDRIFAISPITEVEEGHPIELAEGQTDLEQYHLTGNLTDQGQTRGTVVHRGWQVTKVELPTWSGKHTSAKTIAPIDIEIS
jgi:uncharacterized protein DUF2760